MATTVTFQQVRVRGTKRWKDADGKKHQETRTFWQSISPFNRDAEGNIKSPAQIEAEILAERAAWLAEATDERTLR